MLAVFPAIGTNKLLKISICTKNKCIEFISKFSDAVLFARVIPKKTNTKKIPIPLIINHLT